MYLAYWLWRLAPAWPGLVLHLPGLTLAVGNLRLIILCVSSSVSENWNGGLISERRLGSLLRCLFRSFKFHVKSNKEWLATPITFVILLCRYICRQIIAMGCRVCSSVILMITYGHWYQFVWFALSNTCACTDPLRSATGTVKKPLPLMFLYCSWSWILF